MRTALLTLQYRSADNGGTALRSGITSLLQLQELLPRSGITAISINSIPTILLLTLLPLFYNGKGNLASILYKHTYIFLVTCHQRTTPNATYLQKNKKETF